MRVHLSTTYAARMWGPAAAIILGLGGPVSAATYLVTPDGTGDYATIQDAVNASTTGDVIELADGVFMGDGNRDVLFGTSSVTIRSQNGNAGSCILDPEGSVGNPHRAFFFDTGMGAGTVIENVTIRNAFGTGAGGAIRTFSTSVTVSGCHFLDNAANQGGAIQGNASDFVINDCWFEGNQSAGQGGAIFLSGTGASIEMTDCTFVDNWAYSAGGAVDVQGGTTSISISGCRFEANEAFRGGALNLDGVIDVTTTEFIANVAANYGGAVEVSGQGSSPIFQDCAFTDNWVTGGFDGVGFGGAAAILGATGSMSAPMFSGCVFSGNVGDRGGALCFFRSDPSVSSCTFAFNEASESGSSIYTDNATNVTAGESIFAFGQSGGAIFCTVGGTATLSCSDVFGNDGGDYIGCLDEQGDVDGNFSLNPLFCGPTNGDFTIADNSPCAPPGVTGCGLVGARPVACGTVGVPEPVTQVMSWGDIKSRF